MQAVTNVDAHRTDLHAVTAVNAIACALGLALLTSLQTLTQFGPAFRPFAAFGLIGNNQGVVVEHGALETRIRAHVDADLFAGQPSHDKGGRGQKEGGEIGGVGRSAQQKIHY